MLKLFKKKDVNRTSNNVTQGTIPQDEFIKLVEPVVDTCLNDEFVSSRVTTDSIFNEKAVIKDSISIEEARECSARITRIIRAIDVVSELFAKEEKKLVNSESFTEMDVCKLYDESMIKKMFTDAMNSIDIEFLDNEDKPLNEWKESINGKLRMMNGLKNITIKTLHLAVRTATMKAITKNSVLYK